MQVSPPKWLSKSLFDEFLYMTNSRQGFKTKYQNPWSFIIADTMQICTRSVIEKATYQWKNPMVHVDSRFYYLCYTYLL